MDPALRKLKEAAFTGAASCAVLAGTDAEATLLTLLLLSMGTLPRGEVNPSEDGLLLLLPGSRIGGDMKPNVTGVALGTPPAEEP